MKPIRTPMAGLLIHAALVLAAGPVRADTATPQAAVPATPPPTPPSLLPAMVGPLAANAAPASHDAGLLGKVYVSGVASGYAQTQDNVYGYGFVAAPDRHSVTDLSNAQIFVNKPDGLVQFFAQVGIYSLPDLGVPYVKSGDGPNTWYGPFAQGYIKLAPTDSFSIEAGKLPTLLGAEDTFSFENLNVERGLLWNQENAVNRGLQANYTAGPLALSVSWNDGLLSDKYSWAALSATYTIDKSSTVSFVGAGNTRRTTVNTAVTPLFQNNEQIYNLIYTHTAGAWTVEPYLQYTTVPRIPGASRKEGSTFGGALLVNYAVEKLAGLNLPVRVEYISSTGSATDGAPNLLYGAGSKAWSVTVTPTYQYKVFFARAELAYVAASGTVPGAAFGPQGNDKSQSRAVLEAGILF